MIDTHCHLLPGLDDGARSQVESVQMARRLVEFGVSRVVCTPHYSRRYPTPVSTATERLTALRNALDALGIELATELAAEISPSLALSAPGKEIVARCLPGGYAIVELVPTTGADVVDDVSDRFASLDLKPVYAHPERCQAIQQRPGTLDDARAIGALVQVVASSLSGATDSRVAAAAWSLIETGRVDLVATDAHRPYAMQIQLSSVASVIERRYGKDAAHALTTTNPARVLEPRGRTVSC